MTLRYDWKPKEQASLGSKSGASTDPKDSLSRAHREYQMTEDYSQVLKPNGTCPVRFFVAVLVLF
jgi:hypothetical protein